MGDFRQLKVWQRARGLALAVYRETSAFPATERNGLTAQLRRAAASIASNVAESRGRYTSGDQVRFLRIAQGSAREVECQLLLAHDVGFLPASAAEQLLGTLDEVQRMMSGLIRASRPVRAPRQ